MRQSVMSPPSLFRSVWPLAVGISASASALIVIDWVSIGNPGNLVQSSSKRTHFIRTIGDGAGSVAYIYTIARNEMSIAD